MKHDMGNWILFLGHFHPLLVHLPIGGLVLLACLEVVAWWTRWKDAAQNRNWILTFAFGSALAAAVCGCMLSQTGGYDSSLLNWHRALGLAVSATCGLTLLLLRQKDWQRAYRFSLAVTLLLLAAAGDFGGSLTHGRGFLTANAPSAVRALLGHSSAPEISRRVSFPLTQQPVFSSVIQPILRERCATCHGPEKHKADLRLDSLAGLRQGGQDGPVIKPGQAKDSILIQRISLPLDAEGHMPPEGHAQPTAEEIALLKWWINAGTPVAETVDALKTAPEIKRFLEVVSRKAEPQN